MIVITKIGRIWLMAKQDKVLVHFYPGLHSPPEMQFTRYVGDDEVYIEKTGEKAKLQTPGIPLIDQSRVTPLFPEMSEVVLPPNSTSSTLNDSIVHIFESFFHTILSLPFVFARWWHGIDITQVEASKSVVGSYRHFRVDHQQSSLGQVTDINNVQQHDDTVLNTDYNDHKRIYFGVSRGAATTFSALAEIKPNNAALCILEAPPSSLSGVFKGFGERYFASRSFGKWVYNHLSPLILGAQHSTAKAAQARGHVDDFPHDIPVMIVSSKNDTTVPHENAIRLAARLTDSRKNLIEAGAKNVAPVYFLQLDNADHTEYATKHNHDTKRYLHTIHALYKKHNLDIYNEAYAQKGEHELIASEMTNENYNSYFKFQRDFWENKNNPEARQSIREQAQDSLQAQSKKTDIEPIINERINSVIEALPLMAKPL